MVAELLLYRQKETSARWGAQPGVKVRVKPGDAQEAEAGSEMAEVRGGASREGTCSCPGVPGSTSGKPSSSAGSQCGKQPAGSCWKRSCEDLIRKGHDRKENSLSKY